MSLVGVDPEVLMSHKPPKGCVGATTLEGDDEVIELSTGQIVCMSVQKKRTNQLSSRRVCSLAEQREVEDRNVRGRVDARSLV
jgi:hypothetical protein